MLHKIESCKRLACHRQNPPFCKQVGQNAANSKSTTCPQHYDKSCNKLYSKSTTSPQHYDKSYNKLYSKSTTSPQHYDKSYNKLYCKSTTSPQHYDKSYNKLYSKSTTNRISGVWAYVWVFKLPVVDPIIPVNWHWYPCGFHLQEADDRCLLHRTMAGAHSGLDKLWQYQFCGVQSLSCRFIRRFSGKYSESLFWLRESLWKYVEVWYHERSP